MTHHAVPGAWSSFTFGLPGQGVSIDSERNEVDVNADLLVAVSRGPDRVRALPFISDLSLSDIETELRDRQGQASEATPNTPQARWGFVRESEITRTLECCRDSYQHEDFVFRVISRPPVFPDLESEEGMAGAGSALNPSLLLELEVDNRGSSEEAFAFIGLAIFRERLRTLDGKLCGIGYSNQWVLGALPEPGLVSSLRDGAIARHVEQGTAVARHKGREGGILRRIPPGERAVLRCAFTFFRAGMVTQGVESRYAYTEHFQNAEQACYERLAQADVLLREATAFDQDARKRSGLELKRQIHAQAIRGYAANTQLAMVGQQTRFNVAEGCFYWRNTMDLCVDHLPFELEVNPWVVRNLMDQFLERYSYRDRLRFTDADELQPGGLSFAHDMGLATCYAPEGGGWYEQPGLVGCYSFMTQEELLNGIYLLCGYLRVQGSAPQPNARLAVLGELLESMERRDHFDPAKRDGILKGESDRVGEGAEITSYDALDHALMAARGNTYIAVKAWCAALLLETTFRQLQDFSSAERARNFANRAARSLEQVFDARRQLFPANLLNGCESAVCAIVEPMAVLLYLGLEKQLRGYPSLIEKLAMHLSTCLQPGVCLDTKTGGLRLSSTSSSTWPSKVALVLYVTERFFDLPVPASVLREYAHWCQVVARSATIADQIDCRDRVLISGYYYPRMVTTHLWLDAVGSTNGKLPPVGYPAELCTSNN